MAYYDDAWTKALNKGYVTSGTGGSVGTDPTTKGWCVFEWQKMGLFSNDSTAASKPYYQKAWSGAKNAGLLLSDDKPGEAPTKGWAIYVLWKAGVISDS